MSQLNRLIHSSGLLSFISCNTDHERPPVSPVIPPQYSDAHATRRVLTVALNAAPNSLAEPHLAINTIVLFCFSTNIAWRWCKSFTLQPKSRNPRLKSHYTNSKTENCRQTDIWVIWEKTSQEFDIHLFQYHSLYPLSTLSFSDKALIFSQPAFGLHAIAGKVEKKAVN